MNKKAAINALVAIILVLIVAGFLLFGAIKMYESISSKNVTEVCRNSIKLSANSKRLPSQDIGVGESHFSIKCPRQDLIIRKDDVVQGELLNQTLANQIIADAMAECWYMVGEGKLDPFSDWENKGKTYCLICKNIVFDDKLKNFIYEKIPSIDSPNPDLDLLKEEIRKYHPTDPQMFIKTHYYKDTGKTYFEHFYGQKPVLTQNELDQMKELKFIPFYDDSKIIIRMYKQETKSSSSRLTFKIGGIFAGVGTLITQIPFLDKIPGGKKVLNPARVAQYVGIVVAGIGLKDAFSSCPECQASGGVTYISPYTNLYDKMEMETSQTNGPSTPIDIPICSIVVN